MSLSVRRLHHVRWWDIVLVLVAALVGACVAVAVATGNQFALGAILAWMVLAAVTYLFPAVGLGTAIVSAFADRFALSAYGITVLPERVALPAVALGLAPRLLGTVRSRPILGLGLLAFVGGTLLGSIVNAPNSAASLRLTLLIFIAILPTLLVPAVAANGLRRWAALTTAAGTLAAAFGLLALAAYLVLGVNLGVQIDPLTRAAVPYGSLWEGNIYGSVSAATGCLALGLLISTVGTARVLLSVALTVSAAAVAVSLSRGAWLGAVAGLATTLLLSSGRSAAAARLLVPLAIAVIVAAVALSGAPAANPALQRVATFSLLWPGGVPDGTVLERAYTYQLAIEQWSTHPIVGVGAGSLGQVADYMSDSLPAWVGNIELHALHDGGLVALAGLLTVVLAFVVFVWWAMRSSAESSARSLGAGVLGSCIALLIAYQATEGTWLGVTWVFFGLAATVRDQQLPVDRSLAEAT